MDITFVEVGSIAVICLIIGQICKLFDKLPTKFIPVIVAVCGGILGVVGVQLGIPEFFDMNIFDAIATGVVSGIASSGLFSLYKNLSGAYDN